MKTNINEKIETRIKKIIKGKIVSKLEVYDKSRINELIKNYGNKAERNYKNIQVSINEYDDGLKLLQLEGIIYDEGENESKFEEKIIIKNGKSIIGFSKEREEISFLQIINPSLNKNMMIPCKDSIIRERYSVFIDREKKKTVELFKEVGSEMAIYERYISSDNKRIDIYFDALETPIYGEIMGEQQLGNSTKSIDKGIVKEMVDMTNQELEYELDGVSKGQVFVKK